MSLYRGRLSREVSRAILALNLGRDAHLRLLNKVYDLLENVPDAIRGKRLPDDARCFRTVVALQQEGINHAFFLTVDDTTTPGEMLAREVRIRSWPASPPGTL